MKIKRSTVTRTYAFLILLLPLLSAKHVLAMELIQKEQIRVYYSGKSREPAELLLKTAVEAYPVFKDIFSADHNIALEIYWADKKDWHSIKRNRNKSTYGMPHMTKGEHSKHYIILPAADIDMPESLRKILLPMLDPDHLSDANALQLSYLLFGETKTDKNELIDYLDRPTFYVEYLINIVLIHEMMHDFCFEFGLPENYGRNGRKAWWIFEGMAQWSVLWVNRRIDNRKWADVHELIYRWIYESGRGMKGNENPLHYSNYAWFHGSLVEMFANLEERFGENYGLKVFRGILKDLQGEDYIEDDRVVNIFSEKAGIDLKSWFGKNWSIPFEKDM